MLAEKLEMTTEVSMARTARAVVAEKQARALTLVRAGHSYDEIAADLGYANRGSAYRLTQNALKATVDRIAEDHLGYELARLDALQVAHWEAATSGLDIKAAYLVLKILDMRTRLLGLDKGPKAEPEEPRTIVIGPAQVAKWEAAGQPARW